MHIPIFFRSWYFGCSLASLARGPVHRMIGGKEMVIFRTASGKIAALGARCPHMNANLALGNVEGEHIRCPLHGWRFGTDGEHCVRHGMEPACARASTQSFPVELRHGYVFVFNHAAPDFPLPYFDDITSVELVSSTPYQTVLELPWYVISGNFVDEHHFQAAHDLRISGPIEADPLDGDSWGIRTSFHRKGETLLDRILVRIFGSASSMRHRQWRGSFACTEVRTSRVTSYGLVTLNPLSENRTELTFFACAKAGGGALGRVFDPLSVLVRKYLIVRFLSEDWEVLKGVRFMDSFQLAADNRLRMYLGWLSRVCK